jgi:shikimate kinase
MQQLKQNALVIFLNPSLDILISRIDQSRPLAANQHDLEMLYIERIALYHKYADIVINDLEMKHILEKINEYFSYQWS